MYIFGIAVIVAICAPTALCIPVNGKEDKTIYTFGFGNDYQPYEMITEEGDLMGFNIDVVRKVCEIAGKQCAFIAYNNYSMCWNNQNMFGEALNRRYWDACVGYSQTKERMLVYGFLGEYAWEKASYLYVKRSSNIQQYDSAQHTTGFMRGSRLSPACLDRRFGSEVKNVKYSSDVGGNKALLDDLNNGQFQVAFAAEKEVLKHGGDFRKISKRLGCAEKGYSIMMRKDTVARYQWFDETVKEFVKSGTYRWLCAIAKRAYGGDPSCIRA